MPPFPTYDDIPAVMAKRRVECLPPPASRPPYEAGLIYVDLRLGDGGLGKRGFVLREGGRAVQHLQRAWRPWGRSAVALQAGPAAPQNRP